jgi:hypothetical protein
MWNGPKVTPRTEQKTGIGAFWTGMELEMVLDIDESEGHHREALQAMQKLLVHLGEKASTPLPRRAVRKKATDD